MFVAITYRPISYTNIYRIKFSFMPERLFFRELLAELARIPTTAGYYTVDGQHEYHHVGHSDLWQRH